MPAPKPSRDYQKVDDESGFILLTRPWRETSLTLEIFTEHYGKQTLIARSARKPASELRGLLNPFFLTRFSWFGKNNHLLTLHRVRWLGGYPRPKGIALLGAWYVNELTYKLLPYNEPNPKLFGALQKTMAALAEGTAVASTLRRFEWILLTQLGLAPTLDATSSGEPIEPHRYYALRPASNPVLVTPAAVPPKQVVPDPDLLIFHGQTLLDICSERYENAATREEARLLLQFLLRAELPQNELITSNILTQLAAISAPP